MIIILIKKKLIIFNINFDFRYRNRFIKRDNILRIILILLNLYRTLI